MTINHGENMQSYYIKPKSFYDTLCDVQPSQPYSYAYGDRPVFEFSFLPNEIAEGDTLVFAVDNDMVFYDSTPENILHSASCMVVVRHDVTAEEATAGKVQLRIETRTVKFRDVTNGKVRPVEVISGLYRRRGVGDDVSYVLLARGRAFANGIIADYDALPEPITIDEYYTKADIDGRLGEKADEATLVAHTGNADIHVTLQDKTTWDSKADIGDIGNATVTITQDGATRGSFSVNASENVTIDLTGEVQADWNETDTSSPSYIKNRPSIYTKTETNSLLDAKADKTSVYTKGETDGLLDAKADKATTIAGYGITDAYTKTEVDAKVTSVYRYMGTVSTYADLPSSGQQVGDVWNIETADSAHGIKAGDNVAWNGTTWDVLAGEIDLTAYPTKSELATVATTGSYNDLSNRPDLTTKLDAPAVAGTVGQVLTKTADGQEWADAPTGGGGEDTTDYLCFTAGQANSTVQLNKEGTPDEITLEYSTDKQTWTDYAWTNLAGDTITLSNAGDRVYFRAKSINAHIGKGWSDYHYFNFTGKIFASGSIMSLLDKTCMLDEVVDNFCFVYLFGRFNTYNNLLYSAPKLTARKLTGRRCYAYMFFNNKHLTKAPELPAKILSAACYDGIFYGCTSLNNVPDFPFAQLANECFRDMFHGCTSLTYMPKLPYIDKVPNECFNSTFSHCKNLTNTSDIIVGTLGENCFTGMFQYCDSLKTAPRIVIQNYESSAFERMFFGCKNLENANTFENPIDITKARVLFETFYDCPKLKYAPKLNGSTVGTYAFIRTFKGCTSLKYIKTTQTNWDNDDWLTNASTTGVLDCPSTLDTTTRDTSHVPEGWIVTHGANEPDDDTTIIVEDATTDIYTVCPSSKEAGVLTVSSAMTLNAYPVASTDIAYAEIVLDVATGATVTAGTNLTFVDTPTAGKRNICVVRWSNGVAKLYVTIVEDLPQA